MKTWRFKRIDYGYRPNSYWDAPGPLQMILQNVKGTQRRNMIRDYWEAGRIADLADSHLLDALDGTQRARLEQIHPTFMGGEYLPEFGTARATELMSNKRATDPCSPGNSTPV